MDSNIKNILSPSAQKVQDALSAQGFDCTVIEFQDSTRTSADAAERVGCQVGQIVKSLIFRGQTTAKPVLVLTSGANRVDEDRVSQYVGEIIRRADAEFVRTASGFAIGGVPPIGHVDPLETYIDEDLLQYEEIWAAAGTPTAVFKLTPAILLMLTRGKVVRVRTL
jgi:prolyl-tRNA editing enzyme YbaK/EbsC (Cys-tRNA(Pro) deacylase)